MSGPRPSKPKAKSWLHKHWEVPAFLFVSVALVGFIMIYYAITTPRLPSGTFGASGTVVVGRYIGECGRGWQQVWIDNEDYYWRNTETFDLETGDNISFTWEWGWWGDPYESDVIAMFITEYWRI